MYYRHIWDEDLLKWHTVEKLDDQTDVFQYERNSLPPHPATDFCILRYIFKYNLQEQKIQEDF